MVSALYGEGALFCAIFLILMLFRTNSIKEFSQSGKNFKFLLISSIFFCLIDGFWGLIGSQTFGLRIKLFTVFSYLFHIGASVIAFIWFHFSRRYLGKRVAEKVYLRIIPYFLLALELAVILLNPFTNKVFYITEDGTYVTDSLRIVLFALQFLNYLTILIVSVYYYCKNNGYVRRFYSSSLIVITMISFLTGIGQFLLLDSPVYSFGFATSAFIIFAYIIIHENNTLMLEYQEKKNQEEYQAKLKQDFSVLSCISGYYELLGIIDVSDENILIMNASDKITSIFPMETTLVDGHELDKFFHAILEPEDIQTIIKNLGREHAVDKLMKLQRMTFDMPAKLNGKKECKIRIYLAMNKDNINHVVLGIRDVTAETNMEEQIAEQKRIITNLEAQNEMSKIMASTDGLTGLSNKIAFIEKVESYLAHNSSENCALIFFDMDHFKKINDLFGHETGDQALREMAKKLKSLFRSDEMIARMGGDEFCIFLPLISKHIVEERIAQMNKTLIAEYSDENNKIKTSASIGCVYTESKDKTYVEMHSIADKAMYEVKRKGRNGNIIKVV